MPPLSARQPAPSSPGPGPLSGPAAWSARPQTVGPDVAILITGCDDVTATVRGYRTMLPRAQVFLYGEDLSAEAIDAAERAGAVVRPVAPARRGTLLRRMFVEVEADVYILAHGAEAADACVAPLIVAEIDGAGKDLVTVSRLSDVPARDAGDMLLSRTVDFLFGFGGDALTTDFKACSRRFARSYGAGDPERRSALDLTLHALRLRMPVGEVTALGRSGGGPIPAAPRDLRDWVALLRLVGELLVEERPRRVFGLLGLAVVAAGLAAAWPCLRIHDWHATLAPGRGVVLALGLMGCGGTLGAAGLLLDSLAKARQDVRRLGYLAIPRRAERA